VTVVSFSLFVNSIFQVEALLPPVPTNHYAKVPTRKSAAPGAQILLAPANRPAGLTGLRAILPPTEKTHTSPVE
jgi:hypothetical protein